MNLNILYKNDKGRKEVFEPRKRIEFKVPG